jgi:hypothetical protein
LSRFFGTSTPQTTKKHHKIASLADNTGGAWVGLVEKTPLSVDLLILVLYFALLSHLTSWLPNLQPLSGFSRQVRTIESSIALIFAVLTAVAAPRHR